MYKPPPGPPRNNMNPPHFQLVMRPLTVFSAETASAIFRGLSIAAAIGCIWWLARNSTERWSLADIGALMAWSPCRAEYLAQSGHLAAVAAADFMRGRHGARGDGRPARSRTESRSASNRFSAYSSVDGRDPSAEDGGHRRRRRGVLFFSRRAGLRRRGVPELDEGGRRHRLVAIDAECVVQGFMARSLSDPYAELSEVPRWVTPLALLGGAIILLVTLWKTRDRDIEESWTPLMASALLASPLGWLYYGCWLLPGRRPFRLLFQVPMLWVPVFYVKLPGSYFLAATYHSRYFWGFALVWFLSLFGVTAQHVAHREQPVPAEN
jgi:hypothetical protein